MTYRLYTKYLDTMFITCYIFFIFSSSFTFTLAPVPFDSRVAVIIFASDQIYELSRTLQQFDRFLDTAWKIQVFHSRISADAIRQHTPNMSSSRLLTSFVGFNFNRESLSAFMARNLTFWESILGEKVLIFQPDSAICLNSPYSLDMFLPYDFIGAPLPRIYFPGSRFKETIRKGDDDFYGGNGGFSLRSKASMIECVKAALNGSFIFPSIKNEHEDIWFSRCLKDYLTKQILPSRKVAAAFAAESTLENEKPLGIHKPWNYLPHTEWKKLQDYCPEATEAKMNSIPISEA